MTAVAVLAIVAFIASLGVIVVLVGMQDRDRQQWNDERRMLIDRIIAKHSGEVIGLDRSSTPKVKEPSPPRLVEGLS